MNSLKKRTIRQNKQEKRGNQGRTEGELPFLRKVTENSCEQDPEEA